MNDYAESIEELKDIRKGKEMKSWQSFNSKCVKSIQGK